MKQKTKSSSKFHNILFFIFSTIIIGLCGYVWHERKLRSALEQAGTNKGELLKVIDHYKKDPADRMKLDAARFLIENMAGHFSYDTSYLYRYRPVIEKINKLRVIGLPRDNIKIQVNPLMDSLVAIYPLSNVYSKSENDLTSIKSKLLISNIDRAFEAYNANLFKDSIRYEDFLEYVLPYRIDNGYCLEDWRPFFSQNFSVKSVNKLSNVHQLCDSLLHKFNDVRIGLDIANQFPYFKLDDYLKSRVARCAQKCWFNCLLLRSSGLPVAIDFVPASRVHESGHEWNTLILKQGIYPIEPFWVDSNRYLKSIYSREKLHSEIGPIEFPKIYRKTFKMSSSELLDHAIRTGEEIPPLFQNPFVKDVTKEYFKSFAIETAITKKIEGIDYAYVCVFGSNQRWVPVDFGRIKKGKVSFNSLGTDNVYLPAFYQFGNIVPAAYPILLNEKPLTLCPDTSRKRKIEISYVAFQRPELEARKRSLIGITVEGADNKNFDNSEVLYTITKAYEPGYYHIPIPKSPKFRFVRLKVPKLNTLLYEIKFFGMENGSEKEVRGKLLYSYPKDSILLQTIVDGNLSTGMIFSTINEEHKLLKNVWIGYEFNRPVSIGAFDFYYVFNVNIRKEGIYELLYWDYEWKSLGTKKSDSNSISFDNVPENALLMIKIHDKDKYSRIFTYSDGKQHWW
ncbi:MAG: hypothetical protein M0R39_09465 [Prolixibacteraceae bacterium]|nr:hypothetical protein [Prolixibacteraceae bacterium]